jgi:hypothetical protein
LSHVGFLAGWPRPERVNLYGGRFTWNAATGTAIFTSAGSAAAVEIQTRTPIGQRWAFTPAVDASITSRTQQTILGQSDSVLNILLTDGNRLQLSQRYGLVSGPDFTYYLGRTYRPGAPTQVHPLTLAGLPEAGLPGVNLTRAAIVDLQPGDSLFYRSHDFGEDLGWCTMFTCQTYSRRAAYTYVVRSRQLSAVGDTLTVYVDEIRAAGTTLGVQLKFIREGSLLSATHVGLTTSIFSGQSGVVAITQHPDSLSGLPVVHTNALIPDAGSDWKFAPSLATTFAGDGISSCCLSVQEQRLVGFYKGQTGVRWGDTRLPRLVAAPRAVAAALPAALVPNPTPAGGTPAVSFSLDQPRAVELALYDALGRAVWHQTSVLAAGEQRLPVAANVPLVPGLYRLRLTLADGRQRLLPLVRE